MLVSQLVDGHGSGNKVKVSTEGAVNAVVMPHPPKDEKLHPLPYRQYMTDTGASTGSNDMQVVGSSAAPLEFLVCPQQDDRDLYVGRLDIVIADASAALNKFGNITALTNGCKLEWVTQEFGVVVLHDALKSNWDFVRLSGGKNSFGATTTAFRASNVFGASEGYIPCIDFDEIFNLKWGLRLRRGTTDCLKITIQDDTTGVDQFDAIAYGIEF